MSAVITGEAALTCLGNQAATFDGLLAGRSGAVPLRVGDPERLRVTRGYLMPDADDTDARHAAADGTDGAAARAVDRPARWLVDVMHQALAQAALPEGARVVAVVGTGLRQFQGLERWHADGASFAAPDLSFTAAVRRALPRVERVHVLANACAASGYALAVGEDLLATGRADAVVVAGTDAVCESMLTMIGRMSQAPTQHVQPFDRDRTGVLLGEGAAAVVLQRDSDAPGARFGLRGVAVTCDAHHETAPHLPGVVAAMEQAHARAGVRPRDVDLVLAHGTGTALNDPTEAAALETVFGPEGPLVTAIKGGIGHTSGGAHLMSLLVAADAMRRGIVPPVVGLRDPIDEAAKLRLVTGEPVAATPRLVQVNAFGFGGVDAVAVLEDRHAD